MHRSQQEMQHLCTSKLPKWCPKGHPRKTKNIDFRNSVMQEENWVNWWIKPVNTVLVRCWVLLKNYQQEPFKENMFGDAWVGISLICRICSHIWKTNDYPVSLSNMKESHQRRFGSSSLPRFKTICNCPQDCPMQTHYGWVLKQPFVVDAPHHWRLLSPGYRVQRL